MYGMLRNDIQIIKSIRRSISMHITPAGQVIVRAPAIMPDFLIRQFIRDHEGWISKHRSAVAVKPKRRARKFTHGEQFLFMGKQLTLTIGRYSKIEVSGSRLLFPKFMEFRIQKELTEWYKTHAVRVIRSHVDEHAKIMGVSYEGIYFSDTKSKWGSCSHDNTLQFNWRLIMAPALVIRYVVIHELTHTCHKNHSRSFWAAVGQYNPSYRQQVKWLKDHGHALTLT